MAQASGRTRYSITLSQDIVARLKEQAQVTGAPVSALVAEIVDEYYRGTAAAECEEHLNALQHEYSDLQQHAKTEVETLTRQLQQESETATQSAGLQAVQIKELQDELHIAKTRVASFEQEVADKDDRLQLLEQEKHAIIAQTEAELAAKDEDIQKLEEGVPELLRRIEQERASKQTVTAGLKHELDLSQVKVTALGGQVADLKGQIQDLKDDKRSLQKQLELVTLRLTAPREGFWARIFGRKKKEAV